MPIRTRRSNDPAEPGDELVEGAAPLIVEQRPVDSLGPTPGPRYRRGVMALWFFQRTAPGELRRITNPAMQRFLVGERPLTHDGDGFVRCIGMSVEVKERKPAQVGRVWFSKIRVRADGRIDPHHRPETIRVAREELKALDASTSVISAGHQFAQRRLSHLGEWRPEQLDLDALRSIVNEKAGCQML